MLITNDTLQREKAKQTHCYTLGVPLLGKLRQKLLEPRRSGPAWATEEDTISKQKQAN